MDYNATPKPFFIFGTSHIIVLVLIVVLSVVFSLVARRNPKAGDTISKTLAIILLANQVMYIIYCVLQERVEWFRLWPMELCEWITLIAVVALWTRKQVYYILLYFWGMAGTLQATLTPDLAYDIPHMFFFVFFISHVAILVATMLLTFGYKMRPKARDVLVAFGILQGYLAFTLLINYLFGTNYGYLCRKPYNSSLFDHLGPWPWYILSLEVVAMVLFAFWYLPFLIYDKIGKR